MRPYPNIKMVILEVMANKRLDVIENIETLSCHLKLFRQS